MLTALVVIEALHLFLLAWIVYRVVPHHEAVLLGVMAHAQALSLQNHDLSNSHTKMVDHLVNQARPRGIHGPVR